MQRLLYSLWREEDGQDLVEYSLLITFFTVAIAAFINATLGALPGIWSTSNATLALAGGGS